MITIKISSILLCNFMLYFIEIKLGHKFQDLPEIEFLHAMVKDKKIKDKVSNYTTIP